MIKTNKRTSKINKFYYKKKNEIIEAINLFSKIALNITYREVLFCIVFSSIIGLLIGVFSKSFLITISLTVGVPIIFIEFLLFTKKNIEIKIEKQIISYAELIKNSFIYTNSIITTIKEITPRVADPIKTVFNEFIDDIEIYNISNKNALERMKNKLNFETLNSLIEQLILCESDRRFITSFTTTVQFLSDKRAFLLMYEFKIKEMLNIFTLMLCMINGMLLSLYFILNEVVVIFLENPISKILISIYIILQIFITYRTLEKIINTKF